MDLVLIHGWAGDESLWQETKAFLSPIHRVLTLNLPPAENLYSYRDAVIELIQEQSLTEVVLVGWSMGSLVAIQTAVQIPSRLRGLVLVGGTSRFVGDNPGEETPAPVVNRMKKRLGKNLPETLRDFQELMFSPAEKAQELPDRIAAKYLSRIRRWSITEAAAGLDFLRTVDLQAELTRLACPTLLIHGEQDRICPIGGAGFIQSRVPQAQLLSYPGIGHLPFLTNPEQFQSDLAAWLATL